VEVLGLARAFERNTVAEVFDPFLIFVHDCVLFRLEPTRCKAVHGNPMNAPIVGEAHGQLFYAATARTVRAKAGITSHTRDGADIDNAPILARNHVTRDGLSDEKGATQIRVENEI